MRSPLAIAILQPVYTFYICQNHQKTHPTPTSGQCNFSLYFTFIEI